MAEVALRLLKKEAIEMPNYIVNRNAQFDTGDNEVHVTPRSFCSSPLYPELQNQELLGYYAACHGAVAAARRRGYKANGCYYCANECHTG